VGDGHTSHDRLSDALCGLTDQDRPRLLLTHYPDLLFEVAPRSFDLALAGHTHGAQVRLPYLTGLALRGSDTRFTSGLFEVNGIPLYVNRGLGTSTYRFRFGARPELTLLTLRAAPDPPD
jgi:predicted MPP superfamily phosphohydrolase